MTDTPDSNDPANQNKDLTTELTSENVIPDSDTPETGQESEVESLSPPSVSRSGFVGSQSAAELAAEADENAASDRSGSDALVVACDEMADAPGADSPFFCVGLGASAGGLEAIGGVLAHLNPTIPAAIVTAQHMSPQHRSMLADLLSKTSKFKVVNAEEGMHLKPGVVFVNPPNKDIVVKDGAIHLENPPIEIGPRPSIDKMFQSIAEYYGPKSVGVVLSGTSSDGTVGFKTIRDAGGITIVQNPESAKFDGMPNSVIRAKLFDIALDPDEIAAYLTEITANHVRPHREDMIKNTDYGNGSPLDQVIKLVYNETQIDFSGYKRATLERQLMRRVLALRFSEVSEYLEYLKQNNGEVELLQRSFLISVTGFFRDENAFESLRRNLSIFKDRDSLERGLRIWVPACATGEEVYSIAIMLAEYFGSDLRKSQIRIYATDIDEIALDVARKGIYPESVVEVLPKNIIYNYFEPTVGGFRIHKWIRDMCMFARHDVIKDPPFLRIDLVSCRNLMIYLNNDLQQDLLSSFHYSLASGGLLFLGRSESLSGQAHDLFTVVDKEARIYRAIRGAQAAGRLHSSAIAYRAAFAAVASTPRKQLIEKTTDRAKSFILQKFAPAAVITDENFTPIELVGDIAPYMALPKGKIELDLVALCKPQLQVELRSLVSRIRRGEVEQVEHTTNYRDPDSGDLHELIVTIDPVDNFNDAGGFVVAFRKSLKASSVTSSEPRISSEDGERDADYVALEDELSRTQDHLQAVIEELETSNEELQSLNEELQASTEELQASNEELETTNEELQATNEELSTVNDELQAKSLLLTDANETLLNIQNSLDLGIILVDRDIRIKRFTPSIVRLFGVMEADIGQRIGRIPTHVELKDLEGFLKSVVQEGITRRQEVEHQGTRYLMTASPYRSELGQVSGAVLSFSEITHLEGGSEQLLESQRMLSRISESLTSAMWTSKLGYNDVQWVSERIQAITGRSIIALRAAPTLMFDWVHPDDQQRVKETYRGSGPDGFDITYRLRMPDDSYIDVRDRCKAFDEVSGEMTLLGFFERVE